MLPIPEVCGSIPVDSKILYSTYLPLNRYMGDLLTLAHDLADRLLAAFDKTSTGLPHPRVNLRFGVPNNGILESCTAGVGSLILEFGEL